jgi:hypothetical protein
MTMLQKISKYIPVIIFCVPIIIITPIITVVTRSTDLIFDPVLLVWSIMLIIFAYYHFKTVSSVVIAGIPVLLLSLSPAFGFSEIQNNPNNSNLLNITYYQMVLGYLIIVFTALTKFQKNYD